MRVELGLTPAAALAALAREAEERGGSYQPAGPAGGRLRIPVVAGLRRGWVEGPVAAAPSAEGTALSFRPEESRYRVQRFAVVLLLLGALGALVVLFAPLFPVLVPALPLAAMLALVTWLFVVAGLRNSGAEELLAALADAGERPPDEAAKKTPE